MAAREDVSMFELGSFATGTVGFAEVRGRIIDLYHVGDVGYAVLAFPCDSDTDDSDAVDTAMFPTAELTPVAQSDLPDQVVA